MLPTLGTVEGSVRLDGVADLSALYLLVPAAEPLLTAVRGLPGVGLLEPAHMSLGYPWRAPAEIDVEQVRAVLAGVAPFDVVLSGPHRFEPDVRGRVVVHLRPADETPFWELARLLGADLRTPHLSVARVLRTGDLGAVEAALEPVLPLRTRIEQVEVTVRDAPGDWSRLLLHPLGSTSATVD